ncbi:hypothetical protein TNCT_126381 [Trichonephila clavata]|uniref:Uncharacterized protein n=1 Tax=Trichonephila clavata TaxID=2740835 RepID=A0A8X6M3W4_TRICU|nr:hypothetical protein TNCT_126381 [Trichonephila clavata]
MFANEPGNDNAGAMSEEKAAAKIQASFKGYKVRKSLKNNGALPEKKDVIANNPGKVRTQRIIHCLCNKKNF